MKSGFVGLIGRPNVGKSTLMNKIIGTKVAIATDKPQTTRNIIQGIYNDEETQIVFVDTPGIHKPNHKLGKYLNREAYYSIDDVDVILFLVDASSGLGGGDKYVIEKFSDIDKPVILVLNKIDKLNKEQIMEAIVAYKDLYDFSEIVPISAIKGRGCDLLVEVLRKYLPDNMRYYSENQITNKSDEFIIAELVREKVFQLTDDEVPHSLTCFVEGLEYKKGKMIINVCIVVDRDALKKIIIGKNGSKVKEIGVRARKDIEDYFGKQVYLEIYVRTIEKWRDREKYLKEFGYNDFTE